MVLKEHCHPFFCHLYLRSSQFHASDQKWCSGWDTMEIVATGRHNWAMLCIPLNMAASLESLGLLDLLFTKSLKVFFHSLGGGGGGEGGGPTPLTGTKGKRSQGLRSDALSQGDIINNSCLRQYVLFYFLSNLECCISFFCQKQFTPIQ